MLHVKEEKDPSLEHLTQEEVKYFLRLPDYLSFIRSFINLMLPPLGIVSPRCRSENEKIKEYFFFFFFWGGTKKTGIIGLDVIFEPKGIE